MIRSKKGKHFVMVILLIIVVSACLLSACDNDRLYDSTNNADGEDICLEVSLEELEPFLEAARMAFKEQLGINVPDQARIDYSEVYKEDTALDFAWYDGKGLNYYSARFRHVDLHAGTGDIIYVRTYGSDAILLTRALAVQGEEAFSQILGRSIVPDSRLEVDLSIYDDGRRSVLLSWHPIPQLETGIDQYVAGYEDVNNTCDKGTLVLLETQPRKCRVIDEVTEQNPEVKSRRAAAELFLSNQGMEVADLLKVEKDHNKEEGQVYFCFQLTSGKYNIINVSVNADGEVTGFSLSEN